MVLHFAPNRVHKLKRNNPFSAVPRYRVQQRRTLSLRQTVALKQVWFVGEDANFVQHFLCFVFSESQFHGFTFLFAAPPFAPHALRCARVIFEAIALPETTRAGFFTSET